MSKLKLGKLKIDSGIPLLVIILILLLGGIILAIFSFRPDPMRDFFSGESVINTLFVIEHNDYPLSTYVLMFYPPTGRAALIDIPGDLGLIIQRINRVDRIDSVYDPRRIANFESEIENLLDLEISFYFVITLENFGRIVDLIEGVEVFIPTQVSEYRDGHIIFPSGINILDGDKAVTYVSYELPDENAELISFRRQRFFIGFLKRLGEQSDFVQNSQVAKVFRSQFRTGINQRSQMRLFREFANIDADRLSIQSVTGNVREVSGQPLIFPHWDGNLVREIVRQTSLGLTLPAENMLGDRVFTVEILNGTTVAGLAARTAELFRGFGYDVISVGNADRNDHERTLIVDRSGYENMARAFGEIIRCRNYQFENSLHEMQDFDFANTRFESRSDFTLILGRDFNGRFVIE